MSQGSDTEIALLSAEVRGVEARVRADPFLLLDVMPVAMFVIDSGANVVFANDRLCALTGHARADVLGRSALEFIDQRDVDFALSLIESVPSTNTSDALTVFRN